MPRLHLNKKWSSSSIIIIIPVSIPVATFKQSENITIAHLVEATCCEGCGPCNNTGSKFMPLPSAHVHGANGQSCTDRILFVHELCLMFYEHVLIMHTSHNNHYLMIVTLNILVDISCLLYLLN